MNERGTLYFLTGPADARKNATGRLLCQRLKDLREGAAILLDDALLHPMFQIPTDTAESRRVLAVEHQLPLCRLMTEQGIDVVLCSVTMSGDARSWATEHIPCFREIALPWDAPERAPETAARAAGTTPEEVVRDLEARFFPIQPDAPEPGHPETPKP